MSKRDPVTHRTPAQAKRHREERKHDPEYRRKKKMWDKNYNATRDKNGVSKDRGDGKDIAHKKPLSSGGSNDKSNLTKTSASSNRGHGKGTNGTKPSAKTRQIRKRLRG